MRSLLLAVVLIPLICSAGEANGSDRELTYWRARATKVRPGMDLQKMYQLLPPLMNKGIVGSTTGGRSGQTYHVSPTIVVSVGLRYPQLIDTNPKRMKSGQPAISQAAIDALLFGTGLTVDSRPTVQRMGGTGGKEIKRLRPQRRTAGA